MKIFLAAGVRQIKIPFITRKDPKDMNEMIESPGARPRIVIVGAGYAGYHCARRLERLLPREAAEIVIVSPTDYMPYVSLLPQVGAGTVDPRHIAVSLSATLRRTRHVPGHAVGVDLPNRSITVEGPDGQRRELGWHRLVLTPGSVSRTLPLPGILEQAKGFKNIAEALYLRDHVLGQMELADASDDPAQRQARCTFVVVGIEEVTDSQVRLSDGTTVPTHTLVWCVGVTPGPLTQALGLETVKGRIVVDEFLTVPGHPDVFAGGDAAAAPDLARPGQLTAMTAQHAQRQGKAAARNVAATLGHGTRKPYKHRDLGFVVDLGGWQAVANPLHIPISGPPANILTRAYHLYALPANRLRVATDWFNDIIEHRQFVQLGLIPSEYSGLTAAEHTDIYYQTDGQPLNLSPATEHLQVTAAADSGIRVV